MLPGWDDALEASLPAGCVPARTTRVDRSAYDVLTLGGPHRVAALPPADDPADGVTVGDFLALTPEGVPLQRLPRRSLLARGAASGTSTVQPLAANVDVVLVVAGLVGDLPLRRIERLLALAWESGATPVVVLTKADACDDVPAALDRVAVSAPGVDVVAVSAATGDVAPLASWTAPGTTLVLLGASGAGKSTIVNALAGRDVMATSAVRAADGKGRHTTTHRELLVLPGGAVVIDTPGLRGVALHAAADDGVARAFVDVEELAAACRFADCSHAGDLGCAVLASVAAGDLAQERLDSWRHLQRELAWQARRADVRLRAEERAKWKRISKEQRVRGCRP